MNFRIKLTRTHFAAAAGALLAVACGIVLHEFRFGTGLVRSSYDLLLVARGDVPVNEAVLVYMDDDSHIKLGQSFTVGWDRALHARLIERLTTAGARAIVFDILFSDTNSANPAVD